MESLKCIHSSSGDFCIHGVLDNYWACDCDTPCDLFARILSTRKSVDGQVKDQIHLEVNLEVLDLRNIMRKYHSRFYHLYDNWECEDDDGGYPDLYRN